MLSVVFYSFDIMKDVSQAESNSMLQKYKN